MATLEELKAIRASRETATAPDVGQDRAQKLESLRAKLGKTKTEVLPEDMAKISEAKTEIKQKSEINSVASMLNLEPTELKSGGEEFKQAISEREPETPEGIGKPFIEARERIGEKVTRLEEEAGEDFTTGDVVAAAGKLVVPILGEGARVIGETVLEAVPDPIKEAASSAFSTAIEKVAETDLGAQGIEALQSGMEKYEEFAEKHPDISAQIEGAMNIFGAFGAAAGVRKGITTIGKALTKRGAIKRISKAKDLVAEALTAKNQRQAFKEGRLVIDEPSKLKEFLLGTKRPEITPSPRAQRGVEVLYESGIKVPTKPGKLFDASVKEGVKRAESLATDMQKVNIDDAFRGRVKETTDAIRADVINNEKLLMSASDRKKLSAILDEIDNAKTLDDVWKGRIKYDMVQPESVKGVTTSSSDMNVFRNSVWKDSRGQMNDAMDEIMDAAGQPGLKKEFTDMSALFEMQENILQRVPEFAKQKKGILSKGNLLKGAVGVAGLGGAASVLGN